MDPNPPGYRPCCPRHFASFEQKAAVHRMLGMIERGRDLLVKIFTPAAINGVKMRIYFGQISWYLIV
jgi:hypothetical protein